MQKKHEEYFKDTKKRMKYEKILHHQQKNICLEHFEKRISELDLLAQEELTNNDLLELGIKIKNER